MKTRFAHKPRLLFMLVTTFVISIGGGIVVPVYPILVQSLVGGGPSEAAPYYTLLLTTYAAAQFLFAPIVGQLSDGFGRRPLLLLSIAGAGVSSVVSATTDSLAMLFVARVVAGMCGGGIVAIGAYVVDVTPPEKRAQSFGAMWGTSAIGRMIGPLLGGALTVAGPRAAFWASAALDAYLFLYGLFVLPESLPASARQPFTKRAFNPFAFIGQLRRISLPVGLVAAFAISIVAICAASPVTILFVQLRLGWDAQQIGLYLTLTALATVLGQIAVTRFMIPIMGDRGALLAGQVLRTAGWLLTAFVAASWQMYALLLVAVFASIVQPLIGAVISRMVPPSAQGQLQGTMTSLAVLAEMAGPVVGGAVFAYLTASHAPVYWPGGAFVACALLGALALACSGAALLPQASRGAVPPPQASEEDAPHPRPAAGVIVQGGNAS